VMVETNSSDYSRQSSVAVVDFTKSYFITYLLELLYITGVQLKSGPYFSISNLFTKIYMLYYTTNLYLQ
jgi:hypothetical protein